MQRRHWLMLAGAGAGLAAGTAWWLRSSLGVPAPDSPSPRPSPPPEGPHAAESLWSTRLPQVGGGELVFSDFKGKALLVNFWATWCPPCVKEMPLLDRFAREQAGRVTVVGIAVDQAEAVQAFLAKTPVSFRIGVAGFAGTGLARELGNPQGGLPFSVLLDRQGQIVERKLGESLPDDVQSWAKRVSG